MGVGTGKGTGKSMRKLCRNYHLEDRNRIDIRGISVPKTSWRTFPIYFFSSASVAGKGRKSLRRKGGYFCLEIKRGGLSEEGRRGGAHRRWEGVAGSGGGGANIFSRCRNVH